MIIIIIIFSKTFLVLVYLPSNILSTLQALIAVRKLKYREGKPRLQCVAKPDFIPDPIFF